MAVWDGLTGTFGGVFGNTLGTTTGIIKALFYGAIVFVFLGLLAWYIYAKYKNLTVYTTPCSLTVLMENGMEKTRFDLKGGVFWDQGIRNFKIKIPKTRKPHILGYIPDFTKSAYTDGRLHFITSGDRTIWQQVESGWILREKKLNDKGETFEYALLMKPVPREIKQVTINSIKNWRDTIDKSKLTAFGIAIGAFIIMVIAHLISLYIQTRIRCPTPVV